MPPPLSLRGLLVVLGAALAALLITERVFVDMRPRPDAPVMRRAAELTAERLVAVRTFKERRGLWTPSTHAAPREWMLGDPYSPITTTLGSREAKLTSSNPAFAALLVRWLHEAGVDSGDAVGITLSGSFPGLGISALSAAEVVGARVLLVTSLGSSSFGANQPEATWLDLEHWLQEATGMPAESAAVTPGAEGDAGGGLPEGGLELLAEAARRCGRVLVIPESLDEGIRLRADLFFSHEISALVNIGGGQAGLGTCPHAAGLPTGYWRSPVACSDSGRGVMERAAERGIPVIHMLNIRDLAHRNGIPVVEDAGQNDPGRVYLERRVSRVPVAAIVGVVVVAALLHRWRLPRPSPHRVGRP